MQNVQIKSGKFIHTHLNNILDASTYSVRAKTVFFPHHCSVLITVQSEVATAYTVKLIILQHMYKNIQTMNL